MPTTPKQGFPYPDTNTAADVPYDLQQALLAVENAYPKIALVSATATTDANGYINTAHGLPFTPTAVIAFNSAPATGFGHFWGSSAYTSTQFTTRWVDARGNVAYPLASTSVTFIALVLG